MMITGFAVPLALALACVVPASAVTPEALKRTQLADAASAFQRQVVLQLGGRESSASFQVPTGKRLVIEYVSASAHVPFGQGLVVALETTVEGQRARHFLVPAWPDYARLTDVDGDLIRLRQSIRAYADGGTEITVSAARTGRWGAGSATVTVSGYLVDLRPESGK